jgi:amidase
MKGWSFARPRLKTENLFTTIGDVQPLEDCVAYRPSRTRAMSADYSQSINVYMLRSEAGHIRLGNIVDPKCTVGASILKKIFGFMMHRQQRGGVLQ